MSTYLQGVTDYIPQFQPFQPDLNFYANALQTKQNQYDTNYKALNNVYGQYFYADLTHGDNLKKKDELIKSIDFNLKRVSGLDLSLEQNVDQAQQVFKPFYQDKNLMKDMAWTKNKNTQREYGLSLKNNKDEKQRGQYWDEAIRAIDYRTEEFKNSSLEETMNFDNVSYTPFVNVYEKAQKIAKDAGYDLTESPIEFTKDGKFMVKTTGGVNIIDDLTKTLQAQLSSDPAVADVYRTKAYVNRKDNMYQNAATFGGDLNAAERSYLSKQYETIRLYSQNRYANDKDNDNVTINKEATATKNLEEGNGNINTNSYLDLIKRDRELAGANLANSESLNNEVNGANNGDLSISRGNDDPFSDIETLRQKVDIGTASMLLSNDIDQSAYGFAKAHSKVDYEANPYALKAEEHMYRVDEQNRALTAKRQDDELKFQRDIYLKGLESDLTNGKKMTNGKGEIVDNPLVFGGIETFSDESGAGAADPKSGLLENREQRREWAGENISPWLGSTIDMLHNEFKTGHITRAELSSILTGNDLALEKKKQNKELKTTMEFMADYEKNPSAFLKHLGTDKLMKLQSAVEGYVSREIGSNRKSILTYVNDVTLPKPGETLSSQLKLQTYTTSLENINKVDQKNYTTIKNKLRGAVSVGNTKLNEKLADALLNGVDLVSEEEFLKRTKGLVKDLPKRNRFVRSSSYHGHDYYKGIDDLENNLTKAEKTELNRRLKIAKDEESKDNSIHIIGGNRSHTVVKRYLDELNDPASEIENVYKSLTKAYGDIVTSTDIKRYDVLGGTTSGAGGKAATYSNKLMTYEVMPKVAGAVGNGLFNEAIHDINSNFDPDRDSQYTATFGGIGKGAIEGSIKNDNTKRIKAILNSIKTSNKFTNFNISHAIVAGEDSNKSAMIFKVTPEDLKPFVKTKTNQAGIISESEYAMAITHGLSFIAPKNTWTNFAAKDAKIGPVEGIINANGSYESKSKMDPNFSYKITPNRDMPGNYTIYIKGRRLLPDGTWHYQDEYSPAQSFGGDVNTIPAMLDNNIDLLTKLNNETFNNLNKNK